MANIEAKLRQRTYRDLTGEQRVRELASLRDQILKPDPITPHALTEWASGSADRRALLAGAVWGGIRWSRSLGRPRATSITDGFTITHQTRTPTLVDQGATNASIDEEWFDAPAPSVWDATGKEGGYRVGFFLYARHSVKSLGFRNNRLMVTFAAVPWDREPLATRGHLRLDPIGRIEFANLGEPRVIPDFEVVLDPYQLERFIQPLGPAREI